MPAPHADNSATCEGEGVLPAENCYLDPHDMRCWSCQLSANAPFTKICYPKCSDWPLMEFCLYESATVAQISN